MAITQLVSNQIKPYIVAGGQITSDTNQFDFTSFSDTSIVYLYADSDINCIRGILSSVNVTRKTFINNGTTVLYFAPEHSSATSTERIVTPGNYEVFLFPGQSCDLLYDTYASRWRVLNDPNPGWKFPGNSILYDVEPVAVTSGLGEDKTIDYYGSVISNEIGNTDDDFWGAPTSTIPYGHWRMNILAYASGGAGFNYVKDRTGSTNAEGFYFGSSHLFGRQIIYTPNAVSDGTNDYYYFLRFADNPMSGFWDQNNSFGLRYTHDVNSGKWQAYSRSTGGTDSVADTGVTFSADTKYDLAISINKSLSEATYWINGSVVARITTNLPSATSCNLSTQLEKTAGTTPREVKMWKFTAFGIAN